MQHVCGVLGTASHYAVVIPRHTHSLTLNMCCGRILTPASQGGGVVGSILWTGLCMWWRCLGQLQELASVVRSVPTLHK